jgi:hypothetical protein
MTGSKIVDLDGARDARDRRDARALIERTKNEGAERRKIVRDESEAIASHIDNLDDEADELGAQVLTHAFRAMVRRYAARYEFGLAGGLLLRMEIAAKDLCGELDMPRPEHSPDRPRADNGELSTKTEW